MPFTCDVREDGSVHMNSPQAQTLLVYPILWIFMCLADYWLLLKHMVHFCKLEFLSYSFPENKLFPLKDAGAAAAFKSCL